MDFERVVPVLDELVAHGRVRPAGSAAAAEPRFTSEGCVLALGQQQGWEVAIFDHYQAMVAAICSKLRLGRQRASAADLVGGSTFSYTVWAGHPHYEEATQFLPQFRQRGAALRAQIADYNARHAAPQDGWTGEDGVAKGAERRPLVKVLVYAGQTLLEADPEGPVPTDAALDDDDDDDGTSVKLSY
jgi:hypothetical protein